MDLKEDVLYPLVPGHKKANGEIAEFAYSIYRLGGWPWGPGVEKKSSVAWLIKIKVVSAVRRIAILQRLPRWQPNSIRVCR